MMCEIDKFCSRVPRDTRQLILNRFNGASEVVPVDQNNELMQEIYRELLKENLLELARLGTRRTLNLWPIAQVVIPTRGQIHAVPTFEGYNKLTIGANSLQDDEESDGE